MKTVFWWWVVAAVPITLVLLLVYGTVQQDYRLSLNDPQIQIAEDAVMLLGQGGVPAEVVPHGTPLLDMSTSLSPWVAVYDASGTPLEASAQLNGAPPKLPPGVFDTVQWLSHPNGLYYNQSPVAQNRFTWQPAPDVRQAVILTQSPDKKYFVAAGRNMRETEQRIEHLGEMMFAGWMVILASILVVQLVYVFGRGIARRGARGG
jgi:hypothetical protein